MDNILVLDDDRNILNVIQMRLEAEGYRVYKALNSIQAFTFLQDATVDLALVDLKLNDENGIEVMEKIVLEAEKHKKVEYNLLWKN